MIFRNARLLDASRSIDLEKADLWVQDGKIAAIEKPGVLASKPGVTERDYQGLWITPGLIDAHVHFREPGFEHKETIHSGSRAAVAGGFTSVACMANTSPVNDQAVVTAFIREQARRHALCRVFPIGAVTRGLQGTELADIGSMIEAGAVAISDDGMPVLNSKLMRHAMAYASSFHVPVISHAEDPHLSEGTCMHEGSHSFALGLRGNPAASEEIMVAREIALARLTGARVHIAHLSTRLALEHLRRAKSEGLPITAEVTPHHLTLDDGAVLGYQTFCKMAPPLRSSEDVEAMIQGLADGMIDMIATDHAPHSPLEKQAPFAQAPNGIIGLQTVVPVTLSLVRNGRVSLFRWLDALTSAPARMLGIPHGTLAIGREADLCVIDPQRRWKFDSAQNASKSLNSPLLDSARSEMQGQVVETWVGGKQVFKSERNAR
ncbi:MAG: Dihydroorotase [Pseudomonadota bacterium]|jgi:dihydroorotase